MDQNEDLLELLYRLPTGFIEFAADGKITAANPMVARYLSPQVGPDGFKDAFALLAPFFPGLQSTLAEQPSPTTVIQEQRRFSLPDGGAIFLEATIHVNSNKYLATITDVTVSANTARRMTSILDGTDAGTWEWNAHSGEVRVNERWATMLGYTVKELSPVSFDSWSALVYPDDLKKVVGRLEAHLKGETKHYKASCRLRHKDGHWVWVRIRGTVQSWTPDGQPEWMYGTHMDITAMKEQEDEIKRSRDKMELIAASINVGVLSFDADHQIEYLSPQFTKLFGFNIEDVSDLLQWVDKAGGDTHSRKTMAIALGQDYVRPETGSVLANNREIAIRTKAGSIKAVLFTVSRIDKTIVATFSDISEQKHHEDLIRFRSQHDGLTGLPNRALLSERLEWAMKQARRSDWQLCVAFLDLDGFKEINDTFGHKAGDSVLVAVAKRLKNTLREVDTVARLGGDEFALVMSEINSRESAVCLLERILFEVRQVISYEGHELKVSASIGVTFFAQDTVIDGDQLLRQADVAMYESKLSGKDRFTLFDAERDQSLRATNHDFERIAQGLKQGEFTLHYQPQVNMRTGKVVGMEALLRWKDKSGTEHPPASFLPLVRDHRLALDIGAWVITQAITDLDGWLSSGRAIPVSINVFPRQLLNEFFIEQIQQHLDNHPNVNPALIQLEIVETGVLDEMSEARESMVACKTLGIRCSLDDFGTGFSTLSHLKHLPVSELKIDRTFIAGMLDNKDDLAIVQSTISLAKAFGHKVVAEGVGTMEQGLRLLEMDCEIAQGYVIARPMPANELPAWLDQWSPPAEWVSAA